MKVNTKRNGSHHLPCLSGLSQAPLIADNGSERSTQISAHSLSLKSPTKIAHHQHFYNHQTLSSTPQLSQSSASTNVSGASIFFPPLPPRSGSNKSQMMLENSSNNNNNDSPKTDINMNAEHERNRETLQQHITSNQSTTSNSPNHARFSNSSRLSSPLSVPPKAFPGFFPDSHHLFTPQQQVRKTMNQPLTPASVATTTVSSSNSNSWPQQDDNYHLYHEPIDPDEQEDLITPQSSSLNNSPSLRMSSSSTTIENLNRAPPPPHPRSNISVTSPGSREWSVAIPGSPTDKSPTIAHDEQINRENSHARIISSSFADRASSFRNDVSADIYFCYVTLKSNERANHRSRSYHGPKNTNNSQNRQSSFLMDAPKNLSSTSVTELPVSPTLSGPTMIPVHFRDHCVRELIETESNYVHALEMIITRFAKPLEVLLKRDDNQLIFGHIRYFHHIHSAFQADLVKAAFRVYSKDLPKIPSPKRSSSTYQPSGSQTTSNPSTPTFPGNNNNSQQFLNASPLQSPAVQDVPISPKVGNKGNGSSLKISTCFFNAKEKFLKYGEYCATLSKAQALLDELTNKNEAIATQLDRCQQEANEGKFKLRDLLSLPMQRILKYHLLLAQLIKNTNATNEDFQGLKRAHEAMVDLGQYINEVKRDTEAIQIINDIEHSIIGLNMPSNTQLTDYGRLVADGFIRIKVPQDFKSKPFHETKLKLPHDTKIKQKRYVFVFDKVMLMCKVSGVRGYQYKEALVLSEYELDVNPKLSPVETLSKHVAKDKWSFFFNLIRISDRAIYSFYSKTQEMKSKWVNAIQKAMDNTRPAACRSNDTNHEFLMHTFEKASSCDHCGKLLLGLYYQGYRCRICFTSVHKKCLSTIRPCGPALPPKLSNNTLPHSQRDKGNEPPPSVRSNCSDDSHNAFMQFPPSNSSSTQCMDTILKNEYSNLNRRVETVTSSTFRENGSRAASVNQRPVSSMINVSLQNSTNHLLQQKKLLKGSTSTPAISRRTGFKVRATNNFDGDEDAGELKILSGDLILVHKETVQLMTPEDELDSSISQLMINSRNDHTMNAWWFGKNARTGVEGRFPSEIVEVICDQNDEESMLHDRLGGDDIMHSESVNRYVNFILNDHPWFCGRMERDRAQALLEKMPHGTFLVRVSPKHNGSYVISLNYNSQVKHMRIYVSKDNQLYLSQNRYFKSVIELVSWYEKNSLVESFHMLDARLSTPFKACR